MFSSALSSTNLGPYKLIKTVDKSKSQLLDTNNKHITTNSTNQKHLRNKSHFERSLLLEANNN